MTIERAVQFLAAIQLLAIGISHIVAHRAWASYFVKLRERGVAGVFVAAFLALGFGSFIVALHPVWSGIPLLLTLLGWSQVAKGCLYFWRPEIGLRMLETVSVERSSRFIVPGAVMTLLGLALLYHLWARG